MSVWVTLHISQNPTANENFGTNRLHPLRPKSGWFIKGPTVLHSLNLRVSIM
jgi:hypothetical protein